MNSIERVEAVLNNQIPDRIPLGFFAIDSDIASRILGRETYWRAKAKSKIAFWQGRRDEVVQSWINDGIELYKKLDIIDIIPVCVSSAGICPPRNYDPNPPRQVDENTWIDKQGKVYRYSPITMDITVVEDPTANNNFDLKKALRDCEMVKPDESIFEVIDAFMEEFGESKFVLGTVAKEMFWYRPCSFEKGLMELVTRPQDVKTLFQAMVEDACELDRYYARPKQSGVLLAGDIAHNSGPMISPKLYREVFLEGFKKRIESIKSLNQFVIKHMCGNNLPILDMMVEAGIDCYQSVQESAGVDIIKVHEKYSNDFAVWGGVQVEHLVSGTTEDVKRDVERVMNAFRNKSKYIFGTSHSVAVGTRYDNFMTMMDEFQRMNQ
ncbi:MAG: hypothetical protein K8R02_03955 [Anaerohalosphaeraceae bacterium]|nr:hypothetical protein [Anaerohalosphaeraceae bacterium]